jgi:serine/threonine protein kinase
MRTEGASVVIHLPVDSFSDETRRWIADQVNQQHDNAAFIFSDVIRVLKENGEFELYALRKAINQGSHSVIYKAYPLSYSSGEIKIEKALPPVAVKFISAKVESDKDQEERAKTIEGLEREYRALRLLNAKVERVTTAEGDFLIMPLYSGAVLGKKAAATKKGAREQTVILDIVGQASLENKLLLMLKLGMQVQEFHDKHFMHGDLHPSNMLITKKNGEMLLRVIDFDQSRLINSKEELVDEPSVRMAIQIRAPEIAQKKIGAPADIYALALNFLFLLGHENPFASEPDMDFIRKKRLEYQTTEEYKSGFAALKDQVKPELYKQLSLFNQKYSPEEIEKLYLEEHCQRAVGNLEILPVEIGGIPLRLLVKNYIEKMLHNSPEQRPTIDEVNAFMRGVIYLVQQKSLFIDNSVEALARWEADLVKTPDLLEFHKKAILERGKPTVVEQKEEKVDEQKTHSAGFDLAKQEESRAKLESILDSMNNIENEINAVKKSVPTKKTKERVQFETNMKAIASMFNAESSVNPTNDYRIIKRFLRKELDRLGAAASIFGSDKLEALKVIITRAHLAPTKKNTHGESKAKDLVRRKS